MKAIILAAGKGTRLNKYTQELPKGMLDVFGKSIIERQVQTYLRNGINDITIVKGYCAEKIQIEGTKAYVNDRYADTNMVESLFCAENEIMGDVIISYSDVLFEDRALRNVIEFKHDIGVLVDSDWKDYWNARYGKVDFDTESLRINSEGLIYELGISDPPLHEIDGRYVGVIRLSSSGSSIFKKVYNDAKNKFFGKPWLNNRLFEKIFMTDFLQELINQNYKVYPVVINRGWLEFDTNEDYEKVLEMNSTGELGKFFLL